MEKPIEIIDANPTNDCAMINGMINTPKNTARKATKTCADHPEYRKRLKSFSVLIGSFSHKPEKKISAVASENMPLQAIHTPGKLLLTKKEAIICGS